MPQRNQNVGEETEPVRFIVEEAEFAEKVVKEKEAIWESGDSDDLEDGPSFLDGTLASEDTRYKGRFWRISGKR